MKDKNIIEGQLPRVYDLVIKRDKLEGYSLNTEHDEGKHKAILWRSALGFTVEDIDCIIYEIRRLVPFYKAYPSGDSGHGMRYAVYIIMTGKDGRAAKVRTAWIDCKIKNETRLITAFPNNDEEAVLL